MEYGGTAPALPPPPFFPSTPDGKTHAGVELSIKPGGGIDREARSSSSSRVRSAAEDAAGGADQRKLAQYIAWGGTTSYDIRGLHAIALLLSLWVLYRGNPCAGECALWAVIVALASREWVGGPATMPSASLRVPLLHDPSVVCAEERRRNGNGDGVRSVGKPGGAAGVLGGVGGMGEVTASLLGATVEIVDVVNKGPSGFDRLWVKVRLAELVSKIGWVAEHFGGGGGRAWLPRW